MTRKPLTGNGLPPLSDRRQADCGEWDVCHPNQDIIARLDCTQNWYERTENEYDDEPERMEDR